MFAHPLAHPLAEPHVLAYFASKSVQGPWLWRVARTKKNQNTNTFWCAKSRMRGNDTPGRIVTNFWTDVGVHDVITCADLYDYDTIAYGVWAWRGGGQILGISIDLRCRPYNTPLWLPLESKGLKSLGTYDLYHGLKVTGLRFRPWAHYCLCNLYCQSTQ